MMHRHWNNKLIEIYKLRVQVLLQTYYWMLKLFRLSYNLDLNRFPTPTSRHRHEADRTHRKQLPSTPKCPRRMPIETQVLGW